MAIVNMLLCFYAAVGLVFWLWTVYAMIRVRCLPSVGEVESPSDHSWPSLSVVVPACDEADKIEPAARSLLAEDYPRLEVILVDDRSTDATGEIIDRLAAEERRVRPIHITDLPADRLGKVNALDRGLRESSGEFVLFTDADVCFQGGILRKAVLLCEQRSLDHLAAFPSVWPAGLVIDSMIGIFVRHFVALISRPWAVGKAGSSAFLGIGAFNLVRRSAFEATEGFDWLRLEIADDMGLALMMKQSGATTAAATAFGSVGLHWYRSVGEMFLTV